MQVGHPAETLQTDVAVFANWSDVAADFELDLSLEQGIAEMFDQSEGEVGYQTDSSEDEVGEKTDMLEDAVAGFIDNGVQMILDS